MMRQFVKMHGAGNDFIIVQPKFFGLENERDIINTFSEQEWKKMQSETVNICHRNFGVGADGILLVSKNINSNIDYKMSVINSDGSRASMCGNGLRCVCAYLVNFKNYHPEFTIASDSGNLEVVVKEQNETNFQVTVGLSKGNKVIKYQQIILKEDDPLYNCIHNIIPYSTQLGVSQIVLFLTQQQFKTIQQKNLFLEIGLLMRKIKTANANFCFIKNESSIKVVTCQLGAGVTLACGTGVSSTVFIGNSLGLLKKKVNVETRGGKLMIQIKEQSGIKEVIMTGPATISYMGTYQTSLL